MPANYQGTTAFPAASRDQIFQASLQAVSQCGFRLIGSNPEAGQISARSGMGLRSWGENILINVGNDGRVDIKSTCRGIQVVDYGKNKSNVNSLLSALGAFLSAQPTQ